MDSLVRHGAPSALPKPSIASTAGMNESSGPHNTPERLLVQIASYNTNLQGHEVLPQNLVDWLSPTLQVSKFLSKQDRAPDIVAVGFQELLPLHLGFSGLSQSVIENRNTHILSQIEANAPNKDSYTLVAKVVNVGVALLVYARDAGVGRKVQDVQTQWASCGPGYMGNKGAVGVRFRVADREDGAGEIFTFVCAHLTAHEHNLAHRLADYRKIVGCLLFPPIRSDSRTPTTIYSTSHLFFFGDLNFRVSLPPSHPLYSKIGKSEFAEALDSEEALHDLKEYDQLLVERRKGNVFNGLHEGDFWTFKCSYKYVLGEIDKYSSRRTPSWTDRIMYATHIDSPDTPDESGITNLLYTSIPSYTASDHKPIVSLVLLPPAVPSSDKSPPLLRLPHDFIPLPDRWATIKRYTGRLLDRIIGYTWWLLTFIGAGSSVVGLFNFVIGLGVWRWWRSEAQA